ncbi:fumarylacetoacetate hydrolase family protein [Aestuariispira insulae]|uniref:Fumarylpyruvate hydrolase n=1 Tax=Aestuariispira insulae TaxID=1461337 RepID=A0A3D9HXW4_9PROT|nr:fumarylacetoacetate hydrolase family protein [Aestuariispira insulae]RED54343.1 fumarylpyruvate hydrolase [Aestuariispira insulae]
MQYVVEPAEPTVLPVRGQDGMFPVHTVYCVGRNYAAHAIEMGHDPDREPPFFFLKQADCILLPGEDFPYPPQSADVHHEMELVIALDGGGTDIPVDEALDHVFGYAVGLDMTRRDLQGQAKKAGRPWEAGKSFAHSAPCSEIVPVEMCDHPEAGEIWLDVNGERRQTGDLNQLIWKLPEVIAELSSLFPLRPGDLIFTGTPAGVGPVQPGDVLSGGVAGIGTIELTVV